MVACKPDIQSKHGYTKIIETCRLARDQNLGYAWVDTCCIDKSSSAELTESINSMFGYYARSVICFAYLVDLQSGMSVESMHACRWFTRRLDVTGTYSAACVERVRSLLELHWVEGQFDQRYQRDDENPSGRVVSTVASRNVLHSGADVLGVETMYYS